MGRVPRKAVAAGVLAAASASMGIVAGITPSLCALLVLTGMFVMAVVVSWRMTHDVFAPLPLVLGYLFWGTAVRGLALYEGWVPNRYNVPLANQWISGSVWLLAALAMLCCLSGYRSHTGRCIGMKWKLQGLANDNPSPTALKVFGILTAVIGVIPVVSSYHQYGALPGFGYQARPAVYGAQIYQGGIYLGNVLAHFSLAGLLLLWGRRKLGWLGKLALLANVLLIIMDITEGSKTTAFEVTICIFVLRHYLRRRILARTVAILTVPVLILVSADFYYKEYGPDIHKISEQYSQAPVWQAVLDPPLNRSYQFDATSMVLAKTKSINDYSFGSTLEELLWWYVPRQWWPAKPKSYGYSFGLKYFSEPSPTASYAPGVLAELYLDFGVPGVAGGFYLLGISLRICYEAFSRRRSQFATVIYAILLCRLTNMIEGPIATHVEFIITQLVPLVVYAVISPSISWRTKPAEMEPAGFRVGGASSMRGAMTQRTLLAAGEDQVSRVSLNSSCRGKDATAWPSGCIT